MFLIVVLFLSDFPCIPVFLILLPPPHSYRYSTFEGCLLGLLLIDNKIIILGFEISHKKKDEYPFNLREKTPVGAGCFRIGLPYDSCRS